MGRLRIGWHWGTNIGAVMRRRTAPMRFYGLTLWQWAIGVWRGEEADD